MSQHSFPYALLCLTLMISSCAESPKTFRLSNTGQTVSKTWPSSSEKPRYAYVGELTGENNFQTENPKNQSTTIRFFEWLTGLTGNQPNPVVLQRPQSGVVDNHSRIYVTDIGRGAVFVFDKDAGQLKVWDLAREDTRFVTPIGIALGAQGEVLVTDADLHGVFRLDINGKPIGEFGSDVLKRPTGLARDPENGRIYVADTHAHDIKVFTDDGKLLEVLGKRGENDAQFNSPTFLAFASGKLYVTDTLNSRIQVLDTHGKMLKKFGQRGLYVGNLVRPKGVAVDSESNIYVIESLYDNLLIYDDQGRTLMALGGTGKSTGEFYLPSGVWVDSNDQVYVADMFNGRITVLQFLGGAQ